MNPPGPLTAESNRQVLQNKLTTCEGLGADVKHELPTYTDELVEVQRWRERSLCG